MAFNAKNAINGTWGSLWINDREIGEVKSFQVKAEFQKEEVKIAGQMAVDTKIMSYSGKGSLQLHKVNSRMVKTLLEEIKAGKDPRFTLIGKLADPNSNGAERIAIKNVSFDDLTLFDFEVGAVGQVECPFTFTDMETMDLI